MNAMKLLREMNPFAKEPTVRTLIGEEIEELKRALYLEDKHADHHRARAQELQQRLHKLNNELTTYPQ